jgi:hypothetical protein
METAGKETSHRKEKLKPKTKELLKKRWEITEKDQSAKEMIKYSKLCKTIRKRIQRAQYDENKRGNSESISPKGWPTVKRATNYYYHP